MSCDLQSQLHLFAAIHNSYPVASWDSQATSGCTLQNLSAVVGHSVIFAHCFMTTMNSYVLFNSHIAFAYYREVGIFRYRASNPQELNVVVCLCVITYVSDL